jgi:hypothetical protein
LRVMNLLIPVAVVCSMAAFIMAVSPPALVGVPQTNPVNAQRFEVASIKLSTLNDTGSRNDLNGTNVVFRNYVLGGIIQTAFMVERLALEAPAWLYDERFDITAKVSGRKGELGPTTADASGTAD